MTPRIRPKNPDQKDRYASPWSLKERLGMLAWVVVERVLCRPMPKQLNAWRLLWLRVFGATITGRPFVHPTATIKIPWLLTLEHRSALAPHVEVYNLGRVILREACVVSQHTYLCAGTHDLADPMLPLLVGEIEIGKEAFVGAKALVLPGVRVGEGAVLGAGGVAAKDLEPWTIYVGNPAKAIKKREMRRAE
jgi:putative colanic acid biosynthesis acetyltransferase WcaF